MLTKHTQPPTPPKSRDYRPWTEEDVPVCNCAECDRELVGHIPEERMGEFRALVTKHKSPIPQSRVAARLNGRPYCAACLTRSSAPTVLEGAGFNGRRVNNKDV